MELARTLETLSDIPEELHDNYVEADGGGYVLKHLQGMLSEDEVQNLRKTMLTERETAAKYEREMKKLRSQYGDIDVEKYNELVEAQARAEEERALKAGEFEKLKGQMTEAHQQTLAKKEAEIKRLKGVLERHLVGEQITRALSEAEGNVQLLTPHVRGMVRMIEDESGDFTVRVVGKDGETPRVDGDGNFLDVNGLVREMRTQESFAPAFKSKAKSGTGSTSTEDAGKGTGGTPVSNGIDLSSLPPRRAMTAQQKADVISKIGQDEYHKLPL
jgi:hypothetical protein